MEILLLRATFFNEVHFVFLNRQTKVFVTFSERPPKKVKFV